MANILFVLLGVGVVAAVGGGVAFVLLKKKKKDEPKEKGEEGVVEQPKERTLIQPKDEVKAEPVAVAEDKVKPSDKPTTPPPESKEEEPKKEPEPEREPTPEFDEPFPTPDDQSDELLETVQGEVPDELREAVSWLNSLNTSDVDNCQRLMTEDTFKFLLKGVKGIRNEDGQVEENLPYHSLSILAQIFTRGLSRNQRSVAETASSEFRSAHGLNVVYDISTNSSHLPSKQLAAILTAFTFAYEPIPSEYKAVVQILTDIVLEYDKNASASLSPGEPQSREAERLVALALHALTLLLQNEDNLHLILEDYIGRDADETFDRSSGGSPPPTAGRRGFSSTSPQPRPQAGGAYSADSPQGDRGGKDSGEVPDLPLSALQSKIVELVSHEDKNIAAWAIRFFSVQALHMTINEKRAFVEETDFFDVVKDFVSEPTLDDETLPVVENTVLAMHSISLNGYDKAKSIILKSGIAKELFKTLVRIDFKALGNPDVTHISPLNDNGSNTPDSLLEPLTVLSPQNSIFTAEEQSLHVDRQVHLMGIVEHTLAIYKSLHHNIQCLEYLVKMGIATPISNILYNYHRKLRETQILHDAAEESYGHFLANTLELLRYLAALGVDEVIGGRPNGLRTSLENIGGIKVQANLLTNIPWDDFTYDLELKELNYTNRGLLDLAFAYTALFAGDNAPEDARVAFDFMNKFRASESPLVSKETPSLYVKYYNYVYNHVENIEEFKDPEEFKEENDNENNDNENNDNENNDNENNAEEAEPDAEEAEPDADAEPEPEPDADANDEPEPEPEAEPED